MPRRSAARDADTVEQELLPPIDINAPRTGERDAWKDPLQALSGSTEGAQRHPAAPIKPYNEHRARYHDYLEALNDHDGQRIKALADVYGLSEEEARKREHELHTDVLRGIGNSTLSDILENEDLGKHARAKLLARHAYSGVPAASLAAIKIASDLDGDKHDSGARYEQHLRRILSE